MAVTTAKGARLTAQHTGKSHPHNSQCRPLVCSPRVLPVCKLACMAAKGSKYPGPFEDLGTSILGGPKLILTDDERKRLDDSADAVFYSTPRMMQHADDAFLEALTSVYAQILPPTPCVLELCASAYSHLPPNVRPRLMVGQGMNSVELGANPALHQHFVQDLNLQPLLHEQLDSSYDVVLCVNGIQYLTQPETVLAEASRILQPGGILVVAFGPYCFREKATAGWLARDMQERTQLLKEIIQANGFDTPVVLDSPEAATAAIAAFARSIQAPSASAPAQQATQAAPPSAAAAASVPLAHTESAQAARDGSSSSSGSGEAQLQVLVALKSPDRFGGAADADAAAGLQMRPDNVQTWFTKPGLAGLAEAATSQSNQEGVQPQQPAQQHHTRSHGKPADSNQRLAGNNNFGTAATKGSTGKAAGPAAGSGSTAAQQAAGASNHISLTGGAVNERLLEQWHAAYQALVTDAVDLGIPRSVIPEVRPDASPAELQQAVEHLQDMMASFLSSGL